MASSRLTSRLRVRSCDTDSFGHVNNAAYLRYCEGARNDYMIERGLRFAHLAEWQAGPVLTAARLEFKAPAWTDDDLLVHGTLEFASRIRFRIDHEIERERDGALVCAASLDFAFVDLATGRPCRVPEAFLRAFEF